jgi:short-subunit dehydrogenase
MIFAEKYGPWALITGASEGTGSAFAHRLADLGVNCFLVARRDAPLVALAAEIRAKGVDVLTASIDLSSPDAADQVIAAAGHQDVGLLIANAGADGNASLFLDQDVDNWEKLVTLNVRTTMRLAHYFGRAMRSRGRGGILLVGSGACYGGLNGISVYSGAKGFLLCFGEGLWAELRHHDVDVLNLILGRTDTPAQRRQLQRKGQGIPPGLASPEDVARIGLEQLSYGPVHNWGQPNHVIGYAPNSPDARRKRIIAIEQKATIPAPQA